MNFRALQHGQEFNQREVSKRVHLYPVGLGDKNQRFDMKGNNYEGFLRDSKKGTILGVTLDCFAFHAYKDLDFGRIKFVKLDVEGFEIAVLKGAQNSLFRYSNLKGLLVEVGPNRWDRASVSFDAGLEEMRRLASRFKLSYILLREKDHAATCPINLKLKILGDTKPQMFYGVQMHKIALEEWEPLLAKMNSNKFDCNFFFEN